MNKLNVGDYEVWKDIPNFSKYQISNMGNVKSKGRYRKVGIKNQDKCFRKEFIINGFINNKGYRQVTLYDDNQKPKTMRVHRLVAEAFIDNPHNLPQVNHKDGNKMNNTVDNLEWISNYDNMQHAIKTGLINQEQRIEHMRKVGKTGIGAKIRWNLM